MKAFIIRLKERLSKGKTRTVYVESVQADDDGEVTGFTVTRSPRRASLFRRGTNTKQILVVVSLALQLYGSYEFVSVSVRTCPGIVRAV